jgi:hypothetical protein
MAGNFETFLALHKYHPEMPSRGKKLKVLRMMQVLKHTKYCSITEIWI